jgi:hypothetical protein
MWLVMSSQSLYILSIYIKANLAGFVCVLLGDGRQLLCSGGVFFGVRSGAQWGGLYFGVRSKDPLVGKCGVFFGVHSGAVAWQRNLHNLKRFHLGSVPVLLLGSGTTMGWYFLWGPFSVFFGVCSGKSRPTIAGFEIL